jgi:hypothetical protein
VDLSALTDATETAIIAPVPAAEPVVGRHRKTLDRAATWGVPAHVTVIYPFLPPDRITGRVLDDVRDCLVPAFDCAFARVEWFGEEVVWLAPEPAAPFRELTGRVWRRFPECPPYAGAHPDPVPHLTVGHLGDHATLRQAAADVAPALPVTTRIDRVWLIAGAPRPDSWRPVAEFLLPQTV